MPSWPPLKVNWQNTIEKMSAEDFNKYALRINDIGTYVVSNTVSDFDFRLDDTRTPTDGSVTVEKLAADLAAALQYLSEAAQPGVFRLGRSLDDSVQATQVEVWVDVAGSASARIARWNSNGQYVSGNVQVGGDVDAVDRAVRVNAAAGQVRTVSFQTGGVDRWLLMATSDAESGSDAGSNLELRSRTDAGGSKTTVVRFNRQTGVITLGGALVATTIEVGNATDTTLSRSAAGVIAVEGFDLLTKSVVSLTTTATLAAVAGREYWYLFGSGAVPTAPTAVANTSVYHCKNVHTADITLAAAGAETFDGATTLTLAPNQAVTLISDNANWKVF